MANVLVTGAGGFIGGHLCRRLIDDGHYVTGVDIKPVRKWRQQHSDMVAIIADLRKTLRTFHIIHDLQPDMIFHLAADMGGMGYISNHDADILAGNLQIDMNVLDAAKRFDNLQKFFYSSSVCVYPEHFQMSDDDWIHDMKESLAYPANPQDAYGWEKLTMENLLLTHHNDYEFPCRIARFHNCYGPYCDWETERAKAPAALCRKMVQALHSQPDLPLEIEVWGDGEQVRPFVYVDDLIDGIMRLVESDYHKPVNLGPTMQMDGHNDFITTINTLVDVIALVANNWVVRQGGQMPFTYEKIHVDGPEGVRYRGADSTLMYTLTDWEPTTDLYDGISKLFPWVADEFEKRLEI